jgi:hypothetical protein
VLLEAPPDVRRPAAIEAAVGAAKQVYERRRAQGAELRSRVGTTPNRRTRMSIVVRFHPSNLTAAKYDETHPKLEEAGFPPEGLDYHVCFGTDPEHLTVSEIWDSREQLEAWGQKLMPILSESGIEQSGEPEVFEVHNIVKR